MCSEERKDPIKVRHEQQWWSTARDKLIYSWVIGLDQFTQTISSGTRDNNQCALFWIRVFGLVDELPKLLAPSQEKFNKLQSQDQASWLSRHSRDSLYVQLGIMLDILLSKLNEDDFVIIDYYRNSHVHVWLKGYHVGFTLDPMLPPPTREVLGNSRKLSIDKIQSILDRRIQERINAGSNDAGGDLAHEIASKVASEIHQMAATLRTFHAR